MLARNLKRILEERNMSIAELAKKTGVPKTNIGSWLSGSSPKIEQLYKVTQYLGVSVESLAFGKSTEDSIKDLTDQIEIHSGLYEISIKRITNKSKKD